MSTTNNQSIRQINTAALRGIREAHQPDEIKPTIKEESMNFIEWLKNREAECIDLIRSNYTRPVNPADLEEAKKRLERISAALNLFDAYNNRG